MIFNRTEFEDGNVYHDYHWNNMQANIAKGIKNNVITKYYETRLLNSDFDYCFVNPIIDKTKTDLDLTNNIEFNKNILKFEGIESDSMYLSNEIQLPDSSSRFVVLADHTLPEDADDVIFHVIHDDGDKKIKIGEPFTLKSSTNSLQLQIDWLGWTPENGVPSLNHFCIMWS